jgi:hypothetical protein
MVTRPQSYSQGSERLLPGNWHVRFSGEGAAATPLSYPTLGSFGSYVARFQHGPFDLESAMRERLNRDFAQFEPIK